MSAHTIAWSERLDLTLAQARQRSQLVNLLRRLFVGLAGAALASVFVFMALFSPEGLWGSAYAQVTPLRVLAPRFTGTSESGRQGRRGGPVHDPGRAGLPLHQGPDADGAAGRL
jgi:hypothetical protein